MKFKKNYKIIAIFYGVLFFNWASAKNVEFIEDAYLKQGSEEIVNKAEQAAKLVGFSGVYEIAAPKKPGIQINPWNKFITHGTNPQTKNSFIIVNTEWFLGMPSALQNFFLSRSFMILKHGVSPSSVKVIPYIFILFTIFLIFALSWVLARAGLLRYGKGVIFIGSFVITFLFNSIVMSKLQVKLIQYLAHRYDNKINELVVEKTLDKDSAIRALEFLDSSIKAEITNGETFFTPNASLFENYAKKLR
ncbi:hypothetical protein KAW80_01855 [Candidatus Babeliales bacterium]|nr:hypothetical protein [Candidatus Babeliales bacterium]